MDIFLDRLGEVNGSLGQKLGVSASQYVFMQAN